MLLFLEVAPVAIDTESPSARLSVTTTVCASTSSTINSLHLFREKISSPISILVFAVYVIADRGDRIGTIVEHLTYCVIVNLTTKLQWLIKVMLLMSGINCEGNPVKHVALTQL